MARSVQLAVAGASACAALGLGGGLRCRSGASGAFLAQAAQLRQLPGELRGATSASSRRAALPGGGREACLSAAAVLLAASGAAARRKRGAVARAAEERTQEERDADPFGLLDEDIERDDFGFRTSIFGGDRPPALAVEVIPGLYELVEPAKEDPADFDPRTQIGGTAPLGFFDPLEFSKKGDKLGFRKLRVAELKHGRVAMMAVAGAVLQHYARLPGFEDVKADGLQALLTTPGIVGMAVVTAVSGYLELGPWRDRLWKRVGDFGDPGLIGLFIPAEDGQVGTPEMRVRELNNGRLAMISAAGIIAAELATGKAGMQQLGL